MVSYLYIFVFKYLRMNCKKTTNLFKLKQKKTKNNKRFIYHSEIKSAGKQIYQMMSRRDK